MKAQVNKKVLNNINEKVLDRITIDLDHYKAVPRALLKAVSEFGKDKVKLYITPSGTGFRLEIVGKFTPLENLYYRCILEDDPYRIRYALVRYCTTGDPYLLDISFWYKCSISRYHGYVKEIPIDELVDEKDLEEFEKDPTNQEVHDRIIKRLNKFIQELYLWTIVIPADEKYIKILSESLRKFKLLKDPYHEDRVILYQVSTENLVEKLKELGIPVITYRQKVVKSKSIYDEGEDI